MTNSILTDIIRVLPELCRSKHLIALCKNTDRYYRMYKIIGDQASYETSLTRDFEEAILIYGFTDIEIASSWLLISAA